MSTTFVPFTLTLRAPAVLTGLDGDPDSARSLEHIPGSVIRGAVARALGDPGTDPERLERFRELVLSGQVRYLDANPVSAGRRALPVPLSWRREKHGDTVHDLAAGDPEEGEPWETEPMVPLAVPFVTLGAADCREVPVARSAAIHHQRSRRMGRPIEDEGALFVYESLDAGQVFRGLIAVEGRDQNDIGARIAAVQKATGDTLLLGRSRRAGYGGQAALEWGAPRDRELDGRAGLVAADVSPGETFRLFAVSDVIARTPDTGALDPLAVEDLLRADGPLAGRAEVVGRHWGFRAVGGFNRKWGLELPQALALRAGSVLLLRAQKPIPIGGLLALESAGGGERRTEGFGRIAFFGAPQEHPVVLPAVAGERPAKPNKVPEEVREMEARLVREALRRRVLEVAADRARGADRKRLPSPSLLARLRAPLRAGPPGLAALETWLGDSDDALRSKARHALDGARIAAWDGGRAPLRAWLQETLRMEAEELATRLGFDRLAQRNHLVEPASALGLLTSEEMLETARWRLIDQVLALAALEARTSRAGQEEAGDGG